MINQSALDKFRELFNRGPGFGSELLSQRFVDYHVDLYELGVPFDVYIEKARHIQRHLRNSRFVLDVGAGFGIIAALLRILGVKRVVALDYHSSKARDTLILWKYLGLDGLSVLHGDGTNLPFCDGVFDGVIALAAMSHIREPERAMDQIARVLRPGGMFYVFEDNNSQYPTYERDMSPIWDGADTGLVPNDAAEVKDVGRPYVEFRKDYIRERFPYLDESTVSLCARVSRGLYRQEIDTAITTYLNTGRVRNPRRKLARHPISGEYEENPLNPHLLRSMMERSGFRGRVQSAITPPYRGKRGIVKWFLGRVFELFPSVIPWMWPTYVVVGTLDQPR